MTAEPNYDLSLLSIELLQGTYVYPAGVDPADDDVFASGSGWVSIADAITNVAISQGCDWDTLNIAPRAGTATLTFTLRPGVGADYFTSQYGRAFRIRYDGVTLFAGTARKTSAVVRADPDTPASANQYAVTVELSGAMRDIGRMQLDQFEAPSETVNARLERLCTLFGITVLHSDLTTYTMAPTMEPQHGSLLSTLNELALAGHARWYCNNENQLVMRGSTPDVSAAFDVDGGLSFNQGIEYGTDDSYLLTETVSRLKRDEKIVHTRRNGAATQIRSEEFIVDLVGIDTLTAWSLVIKHQRKSPFIPTTLTTYASAEMDWDAVQPTTLVTVKLPHRTHTVTVGIATLRHDINSRRWSTTFELIPRYFVTFDDLADLEDVLSS